MPAIESTYATAGHCLILKRYYPLQHLPGIIRYDYYKLRFYIFYHVVLITTCCVLKYYHTFSINAIVFLWKIYCTGRKRAAGRNQPAALLRNKFLSMLFTVFFISCHISITYQLHTPSSSISSSLLMLLIPTLSPLIILSARSRLLS